MRAFKSFFKEVNSEIDYDPEELKRGIEVELEHTNYKAIATIIAKHHLAEDKDYYKKLVQCVEKKP
jgi:translation elongation factor EF-Tu-like GTPase